jgi:2-amino-4-hydroxy-6-hydroxymethyldihydropteridine diphosphokinase
MTRSDLQATSAVTAYLALGSNLGDRAAILNSAISALKTNASITVVRVSRFHETTAVGPGAQPDYLNAAVQIQTTLSPRELLDTNLKIEAEHGRDRSKQEKWGPRLLDIDILLYGSQIIDEPGLRVPHPHMTERLFVLQPLGEIAPHAVHPATGRAIHELLIQLEITSISDASDRTAV